MSELFTLFGGDASIDGDVVALLGSADRRSRMAAYAYLYANPDADRMAAISDALMGERTIFGQYWGVRALRKLVDACPTALDPDLRGRLERFGSTLDPETDGAGELRQLLATHEAPPAIGGHLDVTTGTSTRVRGSGPMSR
ncbi:MAG: hypothetical protein ACRDZZ_02525 [Ilumatobacteraceae bacterium]